MLIVVFVTTGGKLVSCQLIEFFLIKGSALVSH